MDGHLLTTYTCPGEEHPISRSVHLSRLAAYYPKCRDCPHRAETGQLTPQVVQRLQQTERRVARKSLFTKEGLRGVYLNELTRKKAGRIAGAFAGLLWDQIPFQGSQELVDCSTRVPPSYRHGPSIVVGYDERPASPDLVSGVAAALRRMGCQVIDVGLTSTPCFWFAVDHLGVSGGIYVTGSGCDFSWAGMQFVGQGAAPISDAADGDPDSGLAEDVSLGNTPDKGIRNWDLQDLEQRIQKGSNRPTRRAGPQRTFVASIPYQAGLWKHFHALRPLIVCCACPVELIRGTLVRLFDKLPCHLQLVDIPQRARNVTDSEDADVRRLGNAVKLSHAHVGVLIDDDGQSCSFLDERGVLISSRDIGQLLVKILLTESRGGCVVVDTSATEVMQPVVLAAGGRCVIGGTTLAEVSHVMRQQEAIFAAGDRGRFWFRESFPACDAIITLAKVLQLLSRSDARCSQLISAGPPG